MLYHSAVMNSTFQSTIQRMYTCEANLHKRQSVLLLIIINYYYY